LKKKKTRVLSPVAIPDWKRRGRGRRHWDFVKKKGAKRAAFFEKEEERGVTLRKTIRQDGVREGAPREAKGVGPGGDVRGGQRARPESTRLRKKEHSLQKEKEKKRSGKVRGT